MEKGSTYEISAEQMGRLSRVADVMFGHGTCITAALDALESTLQPGDRRNVHLKALQHLDRELGGQWCALDEVLGEVKRSAEDEE